MLLLLLVLSVSLSTLFLAFPLALSFCARSLSRWEHTTLIRQRSLSVARSRSFARARAHSLSFSLSLSLSTQAHTKRFKHTRAHIHKHKHSHIHTITLPRTSHAHARHACSMTLGERVCVCQGVSTCVLWPPSTLSGTLSTHLHSSTCPQRNPYTRRRLRCRHSDRQPGHLVIF